MSTEFDEIRPYHDEELPQIYEELIADPAFRQVAAAVMPGVPFEAIAARMRGCHTKLDFQKAFCYPFLKDLMKRCTEGVEMDNPDPQGVYTYISNHRDIVLDSGFLSVLLVEAGGDTPEIAIGDNLLIYPWIKKLVRINKSFIVQRALTMRQMLQSSARMSAYMHYAIREKHQSIWIAQREGRAKDSDDRTQDSILKMLVMGGEGTILQRLREMNVHPLSISYEYDPCDYLKAQEFQQKRDDAAFKKSQADDLKNMQTGIFGMKGHVHFQANGCINVELDKLDDSLPKQELFARISALIDRRIHAGYKLYPNNYVAHDLLYAEQRFTEHYTEADRQRFSEYLEGQLQKIELPHKDVPFLREKLLLMYANPLTNQLKALEG
ncbi:MAG: acyltransferase [Bacteroidaceae bacterium]|nr:acyltransferase [Bacteroidaceae bacterium]MBQ9885080.1 acyltransferase [Bacteroidaceae bacterium]